MQRYANNCIDRRGNAISGAAVTVLDEDGNVATIYSDDGVTTQDNPMTTNADGEYTFFAANGKYTIQTVAEGFGSDILDNIVLFDPGSDVLVITDVGSTRDLAVADQNTLLNLTAALTITPASVTPYPAGYSVLLRKGDSSGSFTATTSTVTFSPSGADFRQAASVLALIHSNTTNTWFVTGDLA